MNQEVAGLLLALLAIGGLTALKALSNGPTDAKKTSVKAKCPGCGYTLVITVENLHS